MVPARMITRFASFMLETLVRQGVVPAPQSVEEARDMIELILIKYEKFSQQLSKLELEFETSYHTNGDKNVHYN